MPDPRAGSSSVFIGGRAIGEREPVLVVAEVGINHDGNVRTAMELVDAAAAAGAEAVKFQTFVPTAVAASGAPLADYQRGHTAKASDQREMLECVDLSAQDLGALAARCERQGVLFLSTPFDLASATLLERLGVPAFKVSSGDLTNLPLLSALAARGKPLVLSTGMSTLREVRDAVDAVRSAGAELMLLHCVSSYPTPPAQANLRAIDTLRSAFALPVGYSDHCLGLDVSLAAVARDACLVERHVTLDRTAPGPDHAISLEPDELRELVVRIRATESMLGEGRKVAQPAELDTRALARRSIVAARSLARGETLTIDKLAIKRPGGGLAPACLPKLLGARLAQPLGEDEQLTNDHLSRE